MWKDKKCRKCKNDTFKIKYKDSCHECIENAAYDPEDEEYLYDRKRIEELGLTRNHVENEGECNFDSAWGEGCYMFTCMYCHTRFNLALIRE